jgi:hypothetical protein
VHVERKLFGWELMHLFKLKTKYAVQGCRQNLKLFQPQQAYGKRCLQTRTPK